MLVNNEQGGYAAGHYLVQLGHQRIGCIAGPNDITPSAARIAGFRRALAEAGVDLPPACIMRGNGRYEDGEAAMRELLARNVGVTAVFAYNDLMAIGAMSTLRRAGIEVPAAMWVLGFDNIVQASMTVPALTTIAQPVARLGDVSVHLLLDRMRHRDRHASRIVLPTTVIERESCAMLDVRTGSGLDSQRRNV